jgi:hypothetical protein
MSKIGDRVGAIFGADNGICEFLGYGVYEGDFYPEEAVGFIAQLIRESVTEGRVAKENAINPRIKLDNGEFVYGCECWWGAEEGVKKKIEGAIKAGQKIVNVRMSEERAKYELATDERKP